MKKSQLAINSVSLDFSDFPASLEAVRAAGFEKIEFALGHVKDFLQAGHSAAQARQLLDQNGLRCIGGFQTALGCFAPDRAANHGQIVGNAELLAVLGGTQLVAGTDGPAGPGSLGPLDVIAENVREVADRIRPLNVNLLLEFNWSPVVKSFRTAAEIVRRSGAANAGVLFDPAHYHCTPTKLDQLDAANVVTVRHVHVNDMRDQPGELSHCNDDRVLPGEGCLNLRELFGRLEEHGYAGDFSIEMFDPGLRKLPPLEAARRMYRSLLPLCSS